MNDSVAHERDDSVPSNLKMKKAHQWNEMTNMQCLCSWVDTSVDCLRLCAYSIFESVASARDIFSPDDSVLVQLTV